MNQLSMITLQAYTEMLVRLFRAHHLYRSGNPEGKYTISLYSSLGYSRYEPVSLGLQRRSV